MAKHGDVRKLTLKSQDFRVTGGSDLSRKPDRTKESVPTSGAADYKENKQNEDIEGVEIQAGGAEREQIIALTKLDSMDCGYIAPDGSAYTGLVTIFITDDSTQDGKVTITIILVGPIWTPSVV